ncbi:Uncharacterised protein [Mycobacteroides abscessus subsp. abscessus]|nr:Uncharacterised protein [Mycobacteroides abscessus subsp. abscessus]
MLITELSDSMGVPSAVRPVRNSRNIVTRTSSTSGF